MKTLKYELLHMKYTIYKWKIILIYQKTPKNNKDASCKPPVTPVTTRNTGVTGGFAGVYRIYRILQDLQEFTGFTGVWQACPG